MEEYSGNIKKTQEDRKAGILLRILAKAIDFIIVATAISLIPKVGFFAGLIYILISDGLFDGRSIGKKVMRLRVVKADTGESCTYRDSILRNSVFGVMLILYKVPLIGWLFVLAITAFEFLLMLGNRNGMRLGDNITNTKVVEDISSS